MLRDRRAVANPGSSGLQCCFACGLGKPVAARKSSQQRGERRRRGANSNSNALSLSASTAAHEDSSKRAIAWGMGYPLSLGSGVYGRLRSGGRERHLALISRAVQEPAAALLGTEESSDDDDDEGEGGKHQQEEEDKKKKSSGGKKKKKVSSTSSSSDLDLVLEKVSRQVGKDLPELLLPQILCFASFEVDVPELVKLVRKQLHSKDSYEKVLKIPEEVLRKRLSWYASAFEVTGKELGVCLLKDLRILQVSPETTIAKRVQYLTRRGLDKSQLTKVFKKSPQLFRLDVMKSMEPRIQLFEQLGMPKDKHPQLIVKDPAIMYRSITEMEENALFLLEVGFDKQSLQHVLIKCPSLLRYNRKTMSKTVYFFQKLGLSQNEMVVMIGRIPQIFSLSLEKNLMPKFSYFVRTLGWSVHDLCLAPQVLSLSMKGRILVRHQFLVRKGSFDYFKDFKRNRWLLVRDEVFAEKIARCSLQEYKVFLSKFQSKAQFSKKPKSDRSRNSKKADAKQVGHKPKKKKTTPTTLGS
jgi:hypothetical protein